MTQKLPDRRPRLGVTQAAKVLDKKAKHVAALRATTRNGRKQLSPPTEAADRLISMRTGSTPMRPKSDDQTGR
jgi:hypothetical protein